MSNQSNTRGPPRRRPYCNYCKRLGHIEPKCWTKLSHLDPKNKTNSNPNPALIAAKGDEEHVVCLMAKYEESSVEKNSSNWFVDSGCSNHMTFNKSLFSSYTSGHPSTVSLGNNNKANIAGIGKIEIPILVEGKRVKCTLKNVLHVPDLGYQLLSVPTFDKLGLKTSFESGRCQISAGSRLLATATMLENLYQLDVPRPVVKALLSTSLPIWHRRLAHVQPDVIKEMAKSNAVHGIQLSNSTNNSNVCTG